ncbi:MAG TPA: TetR/AcrR family transcriptional regulator C-terminal domain-containing protein [Candidatus Dormibacteraeota bacterium]|nr:TetR/AcrR family transcriptional regulator C-terminal domain-containing protein [Candidatus Dormibacteraeota bacterium]
MNEHRRERLNRDRVAAAALALLEREGPTAFSMRRLGAELGVEAMALYKHFPSRAAIVDAALALVLAELGPPAAGSGRWQEELRRWGRDLRAVALRHPRIFPLLVTSGLDSPGALPYAAVMTAVLERAGFHDQHVVDSMRALFGFVIGFVLWDVKDTGLPGARARRRGGRLQDRSFEFGLTVVVNGLETVLQGEGARP